MTTTPPDSAKKHQTFEENMKRLHSEIERMVYSAEIACAKPGFVSGYCTHCAFNVHISDPICPVISLRAIIGEHP